MAAGIMEAGEQAQQAAVRIAEQQAGIALDESSIAPLQANPSVLHARTSKRDAAGHPTGLDLLQVCTYMSVTAVDILA